MKSWNPLNGFLCLFDEFHVKVYSSRVRKLLRVNFYKNLKLPSYQKLFKTAIKMPIFIWNLFMKSGKLLKIAKIATNNPKNFNQGYENSRFVFETTLFGFQITKIGVSTLKYRYHCVNCSKIRPVFFSYFRKILSKF